MPRVLATVALVALACSGDDDGASPDAGVTADAGPPPPPPIVETASGPVQGERGIGFVAFEGIPYAEPPVGGLRWRAPVPARAWALPIESAIPAGCPQAAFGFDGGDEDCLYVNVYTPDPIPDGAPVMVWIHGGAFIFGEGVQTDGKTRGDFLARDHGVVVVSMNYRLGALGFMAHPALGAEGGGTSGNYGFLDQVLALEWVRDHIGAFGGNPANVTIFGESAGGMSVCLHMQSPRSAGLFHRAISQSGFCEDDVPSLADAETVGVELSTALGCEGATDVLACLRGKTVDEIFAADGSPTGMTALTVGRRWWPTIDGTVIPDSFRAQVEAGEFNRVPAIVGWNADEGTLFVALAELDGVVADEAAYREGIERLATDRGLLVADVEAAYPLAAYPSPGDALAAALGHAVLACPSRRAARVLAPQVETRVYRFEYRDADFQLPAERDLGAFHSAEIQFVFGHPATLGRNAFSGDERALYETVSGYWARFARTGDPGAGAPPAAWPPWDPVGEPYLAIDLTTATGTAPDRDACVLWDR